VTAIEDSLHDRPETIDGPVYVYGVVRADALAPGRAGVLGADVAVVDGGAVGALVSPVESEHVRAKRRDLLAHSDVLQEAYAEGVVLPLRFGTVFGSPDELRTAFLEPRRDELSRLLDRFDGLCEMRLRADYHDSDSILASVAGGDPEIVRLREQTRATPGAQPLLLQLGERVAKRYQSRRDADAQEIVTRLGAIAEDVRTDEPDGELTVVKASFLIRERDRRGFDELLESVALGLRHLVSFRCTGPLPPHSFVVLGGG
jgi:gas vesicle protein GvpL/GvpF